MEPKKQQGSILYISDCANIKDDKIYVIPRTVIKKQGYEIVPVTGIRESIQILKDKRNRIILVIVNASNVDSTRLLAQVLKVHSAKAELPVYFIAASFPPPLHDFLIKYGFINLISLSTSSPAELVASIDSMLQNLNCTKGKLATQQRRLIVNDIRNLKSLPPLPDVYFKIETLANDDSATSTDFSKVLELDSAITARLLRMSNSAYFGFKREIKSVKDAVTLMGTKEILSLVRIACITSNLKVPPKVEKAVKDIWIHSATCAMTAQLICQKRGLADKKKISKEDLLICGILHDIGKIILWKFFPDLYMPVMINCADKMHPTEQEERKYLGCSHAEVGKSLAEHWQLPDHIANVIAFHHKPLVKPNADLVYIIHIADLVCKIIEHDFQIEAIPDFEEPDNDLYTRDEIVALAHDLDAEIKEQSEHVITMIFR